MTTKHAITDRPVRVAVIGAGFWSIFNHIPELAARDDVELVSVCRLGAKQLDVIKRHWGFAVASEDYREALDAGVDAAIVATPNTLHHEHAIAALSRDLHVMVEKPLAPSASEAWEIVEEAERRGRHLLVPYGWHYKAFVRRAKELLDAGSVGDVRYVLCHMASPTPHLFEGRGGYGTTEIEGMTFEASPSTWADPASRGGYAMGQLTHSVGMLCWLTGLRASAVTARTALSTTGVDVVDAAVVEFEGGALCALSGCGLAPAHAKYQVDIRIYGSEGMLLLDIERERCELLRHDGADQSTEVAPGSGDYECVGPPHEFIDLIRGERTENSSPGEAAARGAELIEGVLRAAETKTEQSVGSRAPA